jgi:hypothetical protein
MIDEAVESGMTGVCKVCGGPVSDGCDCESLREPDPRCDHCRFFYTPDQTCRRFPPSIREPRNYGFPSTHPGVFCGEFEGRRSR